MQAQTATAAPIGGVPVEPTVARTDAGVNPEVIQYGWCPFGDIKLVNGDGTCAIFAQSADIMVDGQTVPNPLHRLLPKNQLIPFPTFSYPIQVPSTEKTDSKGRALLETSIHTMPALHAAVSVLRQYSGWGFTLLSSLRGVDQGLAMRIFQVVQPLDYRLGDLPFELTMGADARIESTEPLTFTGLPDYVVQPLRSESEREMARAVAAEMASAADIAIAKATEILDQTEAAMIKSTNSGKGKPGPDPLDKRLSLELGRTLPQFLAKTDPVAEVAKKVDRLVDHVTAQDLERENEKLRQQLADAQAIAPTAKAAASSPVTEPGATTETVPTTNTVCGRIKGNGEPCRTPTKNGEACASHKE